MDTLYKVMLGGALMHRPMPIFCKILVTYMVIKFADWREDETDVLLFYEEQLSALSAPILPTRTGLFLNFYRPRSLPPPAKPKVAYRSTVDASRLDEQPAMG